MKKITVSGLELVTIVRTSSNNMQSPNEWINEIPVHTVSTLQSILALND